MRRFVCALAFLGACSSREDFLVRLEVPFTAEERSAIIMTRRPDAGPIARAFDLDQSGSFESILEPQMERDSISVFVLAYTASLAELALAPGPLTLGASGRELPDVSAAYRVTSEGSKAGAWARSDVADVSIASLRIASAGVPCPTFTSTTVAIPGSIRFMTRATLRGVIVQTQADDFYYVERGGAVEFDGPLGTNARPLQFFSGFYEEGGNAVFLGADIGGVWSGTLGPEGCDAGALPCRGSFEESSIVTNADEVTALIGPPHGTADVMYALTERGSFERFDAVNRWQRLHDFVDTPGFAFRGGVAYVGANEAAGVEVYTDEVVRYRDGAILGAELPPHGPPAGVTAIAFVPGIGLVAGAQAGSVSIGRAHGATWMEVATSTPAAAIGGIAAYKAGFAWVDDNGSVRGYSPSEGLCGELARAGGAQFIAIVGDAIVVAGGGSVTWLEPR